MTIAIGMGLAGLAVGMAIGWSLALSWATRARRRSRLDLSFKRAKERENTN